MAAPCDDPPSVPPVIDILQKQLFEIGGKPVSIATIAIVAAILLSAIVVSRIVRFFVHRSLVRRGVAEGRRMRSLERLVYYAIIVVAGIVALETLGIDLGAVIAASAVFALGVGLALQGVAVNFVSGVILLVERSIKVDDILEIDGQFCRVMDLGIRATRVRTLFEEDIVVPNSLLVQQSIKNITLHDSLVRIAVAGGVAYDSDVGVVRSTLQEIALAHPDTDSAYPPAVFLTDFAASALVYEVSVWIHDPWKHRLHRSLLREKILTAFRARGIVLSFPQLDVHVHPRVAGKLGRAA